MSLTYNTYQAALAELMVVDSVTEPNFVDILPSIIDYAEQRIYRELDLLSAKVTATGLSTTAGTRAMALPTQNPFVAVEAVTVIASTLALGNQKLSNRQPLLPVSRDLLDAVYANAWQDCVPVWFAMQDSATILFGPWPDQAYGVEVTGIVRPSPLSNQNTTTFLSTNLPDLFLAASMIFASGYQKNFGSQSDDPQMAVSWSAQYDKLMASAMAEEARKKFQGSGWTSLSAPVGATPNR